MAQEMIRAVARRGTVSTAPAEQSSDGWTAPVRSQPLLPRDSCPDPAHLPHDQQEDQQRGKNVAERERLEDKRPRPKERFSASASAATVAPGQLRVSRHAVT